MRRATRSHKRLEFAVSVGPGLALLHLRHVLVWRVDRSYARAGLEWLPELVRHPCLSDTQEGSR